MLYRHFIRSAPGHDRWFQAAGLDRIATEASIGMPIPTRWTQRFAHDLALLERIAGRVGAKVHVIGDRLGGRTGLSLSDACFEVNGLCTNLPASPLQPASPRPTDRLVSE